MRYGLGRRVLFCCIILTYLLAGWGYAAEDYPQRPINFIIPLGAGATGDVASRLLIKGAEKHLGQPLVPVNKAGGGTTIGIAAIAAAKPDGYTIGYATHSGVFVGPLLAKLPYYPTTDLTPIMQFGALFFGVNVRASSPFKSFAEIIAYARKNPKKLTYGTNGPSSMQYFIMSQVAKKEKVEFTHIPFKGSPEETAALLGGNVDFVVDTVVQSLVEAGEVRVLLTLNEERSPDYPNVPTLKDLGFDVPTPMILSVMGPKGLPAPMVKRLEDAFAKALKEPVFIKGMRESLHYPIIYRNSKDLGEYMTRNVEAYRKILTEMNLIK